MGAATRGLALMNVRLLALQTDQAAFFIIWEPKDFIDRFL